MPRPTSATSLPARRPTLASTPPTLAPTPPAAPATTGSTHSEPGRAAARSSGLTLWPRPPARDEDEALAQLGVLVGQLHRHAAAQRVPDDRRALDPMSCSRSRMPLAKAPSE